MSDRGRRTPPAPAASGPLAHWATERVPTGVPYTQVLRTPNASPPLALMGVGLGVISFIVVSPLVMQVMALAYWIAIGQPGAYADTYGALARYEVPFGLTMTHLGLAMLIPITFGLLLFVHRVRPAFASSVMPGLRWRYLGVSMVVGFVTLLAVLVVQNLLAPGGASWELSPQPGFWWFALAVVLTSPLQAAAEEYFFRGYLMQSLGSLYWKPWFGIIASAALFALFHGSQQNLPLLLDRFAFGLLAGILVWRTGGLEAAIAAHVANNVSAFMLAGLTTSMAEVKATSVIDWATVGWDLARFTLFVVVALWVARMMQLSTTTGDPGLSRGRQVG